MYVSFVCCRVYWNHRPINKILTVSGQVTRYSQYFIYTGCNRRNVPDFGRVFLMLYYTDVTQNTYVQSRTVTEIIAREKCGLHRSRRTIRRP